MKNLKRFNESLEDVFDIEDQKWAELFQEFEKEVIEPALLVADKEGLDYSIANSSTKRENYIRKVVIEFFKQHHFLINYQNLNTRLSWNDYNLMQEKT